MTSDKRDQFVRIVANFVSYASKHLPDDVMNRLEELQSNEETERGKTLYTAMFDNLRQAHELDRPICQDTGIIQFFVRVGTRFPFIDQLESVLTDAVIKATEEAPLRHNAVEIFDEKNTGSNIGYRVPWLDWDIIPGSDEVEIYLYMAGGGCSLPGMAKVLMPLEGYEGIVSFVFDRITSLGINACPPLLVGVGIAGSAEIAAKLSKKALLRPIGTRNPHPVGADLEVRMEKGLNALGIGPGGLTGTESVMAVHIEQAARHPATLAVGISTSCWVHRRAHIRIDSKLNYAFLSHKQGAL